MDDKNKWLSDMLKNFDERILKAKLNKAMDIVKNGTDDELKNAFNKIDTDEVIEKIDSLDKKDLKNSNINIDELKKSVTEEDLNKVSKVIGKDGDKIIAKLKDLLK